MLAFNENGCNNDKHAYECKSRCAREFVDIAVERKRIRDAYCAEGDDELTLGEQEKDRDFIKMREDGANDMGYCVSCVISDKLTEQLFQCWISSPIMIPKAHMPVAQSIRLL